MKFCCERFQENVEEYKVIENSADELDETEWYLVGGGHIYYCPFCGTFIKGKGFGQYDQKYPHTR
jgi:hypothetical protein